MYWHKNKPNKELLNSFHSFLNIFEFLNKKKVIQIQQTSRKFYKKIVPMYLRERKICFSKKHLWIQEKCLNWCELCFFKLKFVDHEPRNIGQPRCKGCIKWQKSLQGQMDEIIKQKIQLKEIMDVDKPKFNSRLDYHYQKAQNYIINIKRQQELKFRIKKHKFIKQLDITLDEQIDLARKLEDFCGNKHRITDTIMWEIKNIWIDKFIKNHKMKHPNNQEHREYGVYPYTLEAKKKKKKYKMRKYSSVSSQESEISLDYEMIGAREDERQEREESEERKQEEREERHEYEVEKEAVQLQNDQFQLYHKAFQNSDPEEMDELLEGWGEAAQTLAEF